MNAKGSVSATVAASLEGDDSSALDRMAQAFRRKLGRSPLLEDIEYIDDEIGAAEELSAHDYAEHLRASRRLLSERNAEAALDSDSPAPEAGRGTDDWVKLIQGGDESAGKGPEVADAGAGASAVIDNAIASLVDEDDESGSSIPIELGTFTTIEDKKVADLSGMVLRGRFRMERMVGRGAQAQVYLARDQVLDRPVAIKVLSEQLVENPDALEGFLAEARLAAQVHHAGCLAVFDFGREGELAFLAMEYFRGRSLRTLLRGGPLEPYLALHIGRRLAEALDAVHAAGIVHRDVKPSNVLVDRSARAKLTDFGVAIRTDAEPNDGMMVGTIRYMAPEQARGGYPDPRSDVFSLAAVVWEMLTGSAVYEPTIEALKARMTAPVPPFPDSAPVPSEVGEALRRALSANPDNRPPSASRLAEVIGRGLARLRDDKRRSLRP